MVVVVCAVVEKKRGVAFETLGGRVSGCILFVDGWGLVVVQQWFRRGGGGECMVLFKFNG